MIIANTTNDNYKSRTGFSGERVLVLDGKAKRRSPPLRSTGFAKTHRERAIIQWPQAAPGAARGSEKSGSILLLKGV